MERVKEFFKNKFSFLKNKNSIFYYFLFLFALALIMSSVVLLMEMGTIPLGGDYVQQQIPFYTNGYDDWWNFIKTGEFPLWDSNTVLGVNNIGANSFYYFLNPFFLPILLFPRVLIPQGLAFLMLLKMALAGISFKVYLSYLGVEEKNARLFAIAYAFCGWNLYYMWFNHFMEVVVMFPLVLLGIEKVIKEKKPIMLMLSLFVLGLANYFFLVVTCFAGVFYAMFRYFQTISERNVKDNIVVICLGVFAFLTGILMCAVVLLPCLNAVTEAGRVENATYLDNLKNAFSDENFEELWKLLFEFNSEKKKYYPLATFFFPGIGCFNNLLFRNTGYDNTLSNLFVYTPLILMVVPSIIESVRNKKISHIFALVMIILMLFTPFAYQLFHGFTVDYGRWQLFVVSLIITYVALNYHKVKTYPKWYFDVSILVVLGCMTFTVLTALDHQYGVHDIKETSLIIIYQFIYAVVCYFIMRGFIHKPKFQTVMSILLVVEVVIVGNFTLFGQKTKYRNQAGGPSNFNDEVRVVKKINEYDDTYFRIFNTTANNSTNNLGMREGYNGVGGFHSLYNSNIKDFLNWSRILYSRDTWTMGAHEKLVNLDAFLGVKYYITKNSDFNTVVDGQVVNDINMYNVPFGFEYRPELSSDLHSVYENVNFIELGYAFDNIITINKNSIQNYIHADNNYSSVYFEQKKLNDGAINPGPTLNDFLQVIKNEEALMAGAILYDVDESGFVQGNNYDNKTQELLEQFPINDYESVSGRAYYNPELKVERYACPNGVGSSSEQLLNNSNCRRVTNVNEPYKAGQSKYVITLSSGENFCDYGEKCFLGLKLQLNRLGYVHLFDEEGKTITFDYHQYINQEYKNLRGFYVDRPVKTIVFKPMIDQSDKTNMNGFAVYEEPYSSYLDRINKVKENPLENVVVRTNDATFETNFSEDKIVVTTIPYDDGWSLSSMSMGEKEDVPLFKAQGGFIAFVAQKGHYEYCLKYFTPMLKEGLLITLVGFTFFGLTLGADYIIKKRKEIKNKTHN